MKRITIVTSQGVCIYEAGSKMPLTDKVISVIKLTPLYFTGDPFDHYCGFAENGEMLFSVYPLTPCVVDYV